MTENDKKKIEEFQKDFVKAKKASAAIDEFVQKHLWKLGPDNFSFWFEFREIFHKPIVIKNCSEKITDGKEK